MIKGMLDLSIPNAIKELNTEEKVKAFLSSKHDISEKADGIKINIFRKVSVYNEDDVFSNFIFSYKRTILYPQDFPFEDETQLALASSESIGDAQFAFIFKKFKESKSFLALLPQGTEFFFEFIVRKPTLSREYDILHSLILLGYAKSNVVERFGYVTSYPQTMERDDITEYAALIGCDTPHVIFTDCTHFSTGHSSSLEALAAFRKFLLGFKSIYGGKIEGVVLQNSTEIFKFVQDDQYDKDHRNTIKMKYLMEKPKEDAYFLQLKRLAEEYLRRFNLFKDSPKQPITVLTVLSNFAYGHRFRFPEHEKKTDFQIREDFHHVLKYLYIRKHESNNNAMFIGRMQPPTAMHIKMIQDALLTSYNVCIAIVKGKKSDAKLNPFPFELQKRIIEKVFPDRVEVIEVSTGNLITAMNSSTYIISKFLCGTDRLETYNTQLRNNPELAIVETKRDNEVSGTLVRKALLEDDKILFESCMHPQTYDFFEELKKCQNKN